jgi:hypothetical protein
LKFNCFLGTYIFAQAQIPPAYYENTEGLSGYNLKSVLHQIISEDHNPQSYSDVWSIFEVHDVKQDGTVWDVDESNCTFSNASYDLKNELVIYPNPVVNSSIYIESIQPIDQLFLYSASGQLVRSIDAKFKQNSYEISGLETGNYILKVVNNNKTFTNKIFVN